MERGGEAELVGRVIAGKYQIDSFLGGGAMGAVYKAHQRALDKAVAIKVMHKEHAKDPQFAGRFQREAKAASRLDHPNAMRVFDFGEEPDGLLYIAMELLDGRDLFKVIQEDWPLSDERIVGLLGQALGALAVAHDMGVVHRDLKPENIMVLKGNDDEGRPADVVKVCDFGIAKIIDARSDEASRGTAKLTAQGLVIGTPEYMSPEQGRGESLDLRSDLYSMGVILYQLLTGRVPFDAETALGVVLMHVTDQPRPPREIHPGVNLRLEAACLKALAKKREERFQNAREMRGALREAFTAGAPGTAPPSVDASFGMAPTAAIAATATGPGPSSASGTGSGSAALSAPGSALPGSVPQVVAVVTAPTGLGPGGASLGTAAGVASDASLGRRSRAPIVMGVALLAVVGVAGVVAPRLFARDDAPAAPASLAPTSALTASTTAAPSRAPAPPPIAQDPSSRAAVAAARNDPPRARGGPHGRDPKPPTRGAAPAAQPPAAPEAQPPAAPEAQPPAAPAAQPPAAPEAQPPAAAAPSSAAPGPAAPSPASFDPTLAQVEIARASATSGVSITKLRGALVRLQPAWTLCYRTVLRARGSAASGEATLHLAIDDTGRVTKATLGGAAFLPQVAVCIEAPVRGARIPDVDTGDATADVSLTFRLP